MLFRDVLDLMEKTESKVDFSKEAWIDKRIEMLKTDIKTKTKELQKMQDEYKKLTGKTYQW